jgi:hypothetical protein
MLCSQFAPIVMSKMQNARYPCVGNWRLTCENAGGRYWDRARDLFGVNKVKFAPRPACRAISAAHSAGARWYEVVRAGLFDKIVSQFLPAWASGLGGRLDLERPGSFVPNWERHRALSADPAVCAGQGVGPNWSVEAAEGANCKIHSPHAPKIGRNYFWVRAFPSCRHRPAGPRPPGPGGAPYRTYDLDQAGVVWLPSVCGGKPEGGRPASRSARVQGG